MTIEWQYHDTDIMQEDEKSLINSNQFDNQLVYMASTLARQLKFSENQEKLFAMAVSQIDFFDTKKELCVDLYVRDVQQKLNLAPDEGFYTELRKRYSEIMDKSKVKFNLGNEYNDILEGRLIRSVRTVNKRGAIRVRFDDEFIPALKFCKVAYTRIPLDDTLSYKSAYASILQRYLTTIYRTGEHDPRVQTFDFTTKQLKDIFGLEKDDYCYKTGKTIGKFQRTRFEQQTLQVACDEINEKSQVMKVEWKKEKPRGVIVYRISCVIATKIKKEPKPYEMNQAEYEERFASDNGALPGQIGFYNWLEEE